MNRTLRALHLWRERCRSVVPGICRDPFDPDSASHDSSPLVRIHSAPGDKFWLSVKDRPVALCDGCGKLLHADESVDLVPEGVGQESSAGSKESTQPPEETSDNVEKKICHVIGTTTTDGNPSVLNIRLGCDCGFPTTLGILRRVLGLDASGGKLMSRAAALGLVVELKGFRRAAREIWKVEAGKSAVHPGVKTPLGGSSDSMQGGVAQEVEESIQMTDFDYLLDADRAQESFHAMLNMIGMNMNIPAAEVSTLRELANASVNDDSGSIALSKDLHKPLAALLRHYESYIRERRRILSHENDLRYRLNVTNCSRFLNKYRIRKSGGHLDHHDMYRQKRARQKLEAAVQPTLMRPLIRKCALLSLKCASELYSAMLNRAIKDDREVGYVFENYSFELEKIAEVVRVTRQLVRSLHCTAAVQ